MSSNSAGVFKRNDGYWEYRFAIVVNGKTIARKKTTDENGNKLTTKREAIQARNKAIVATREERKIKPPPARRTVKEVFEEFRSEGRKDRAY